MAHKINVLLCAPGEKCEGGISAVVFGLIAGLNRLESVQCKRIVYAKPRENLSRFSRAFYEMVQFSDYLFQILSFKHQIVHVQSSFDQKTLIRDALYLMVARLFGRRFILHAHGGAWHERGLWSAPWRRFSKAFLEGCSLVLVTSNEELGQIKEIGPKIAALKIDNPVLPPIDLKLAMRKPIGARRDRFRILFASRHIETKGILDTVRAFSLVRRSDCELHLFGDGPLHETAKGLARSLGIADRAYFHGNVSLEDLVEEYLNSDVYLFPSYHHEGFPMALFFAAACSLPIVSTKVRPLPDFFVEPQNCLWVEPKDPEMLAGKLEILLNDVELQASMAANNQILVNRFDPDKIAGELESIYFRLLDR